ncbi:type VI secretion system lipoprotein TssJ [Nannocystis bainbridge]|uniref:Type VI secretion system lipoprotein TssJ n=1 Tax=Nannocystis bainbridge TaxID=2995303 RepID=A0ABT5EFD1_9BACT|nr:type VI secretion system lipoprotein TssJ [Nannocystis bainbridge]MDC0723556.1 type VI secretion system lipoprotein TssJ [Nannocystis bainbridge]
MTRRSLLAAMLVALASALPGCKAEAPPKTPKEPTVTLTVRAAKNSNNGRPLQVVVRTATRKSFVEDDYSTVARLVVQPDETVVQTLVVLPGQESVIPLTFAKAPEAIAVYGLFSSSKGESWKLLAERPAAIAVITGESAFERSDVRVRDISKARN